MKSHNTNSTKIYTEEFHKGMLNLYKSKSRWTKLRLEQVMKMVNPIGEDKILDLGCSSGAIAHFCSIFGANVAGVDFSKSAIKTARELFQNNNLVFYKRNVSNLYGFKNESFNKATAFDLIEHIPHEVFEGMLKEAYRVLTPNGTLSIYTPCPSHIIEQLKARNLLIKHNPTHIAIRTMDEIVLTLKKYGFEIDMAYYTPSFIPVINLLECICQPLPFIGKYFRYRICVRGVKR